jgi:acyl transferase domain-containing protein/SAM-dependent methyltransferase
MTPPAALDPVTGMSSVKRALVELREMRAKLEAFERARGEPIAIVGMGCRFPGGANDPDGLWRLLSAGVDAISEVPPDRWDIDAYYDPDLAVPGKMACRWGGFIDGMDRFDPQFFGISPREAMAMDPQQRLLLEVAWEALEHAGQAPDRLVGSASGVFMGISSFDYAHLALSVPEEAIDSYLAQGLAHSASSGRLAYLLGLQGPALSLDSACSSSLVAVHLAVQSLRRGECGLALAGGVNAILLPEVLIGFTKAQMLAADGRCKTFDARADGFVRAEGCGVVVLKRLSDALADRDHVWAVIRGSASNQDGRSSGMTAPNGLAQQAVIRSALTDAGIQPSQVGYVEAHGTGTSLGDPIEVQALGEVLAEGRAPDRPVLLGSIKSNLGHLEAAAGVAGLMKAALALHYREVPPSIHFETPNPYIAWSELPVVVAAARTPLPVLDGRAVVGVSSFGFTGTNVHVILEAASAVVATAPAIEASATTPERPLHILKLAARTDAALDALIERWTEFLEASPEAFRDICYTANVGRADLPERLAVVAASAAAAREKLTAHTRGDEVVGVVRGRALDTGGATVAFLFTGHGAQRLGMGRHLYETQPTFRAALDECDALLRPYLDRPLLSVLYPASPDALAAERLLLDGMTYSQPALFAVEYALARLWLSWGVRPTLLLGHSVGEYAAAVIAGVFGLADGIKLVAARGRLMDALPERGAMLAVFATEAEVATLVAPHGGQVAIAAVNGPTEVVLSGESAAIAAVVAELGAREIEIRRLVVAQAGHSHLLDPMLAEFEAVAATVRYASPRIGLVSCTSGELASAAEICTPAYWRRHLRRTVRFDEGIRTLRAEGAQIFLEVGPHPHLLGMAGRCLADGEIVGVPSLRRDLDDWQQMLESVAALYTAGATLDWPGFERDYASRAAARRRIAVPTYPWQHRSYWMEGSPRSRGRGTEPEAVWSAVLESASRQELQGPLDLALPRFPDRLRALSRLSTALIAETLRGLGARVPGETRSAAELIGELGMLPRYERLVARWLRRLVDAGSLAELPLADTWREAESVLADWPFLLDYLRRCEVLLSAILTGRQNPLETIFPNGSFEIADELYRDSALPRYYNALAGYAVSALMQARAGERLRALEIGAGTGGATATLAPLFERTGGSYHFTDVSDLFLARAVERFGELSCMSFGLLDVDRDPVAQGHASGSFDIIIGANVVHAVADIPATLSHLRRLLAPGGVLLLIEVTTYQDWFDVSTALLEGWDRHGDELRGEHPMLSASAWEHAMRAAGYANVVAYPSSGCAAEVMGQHLLLAQAPLTATVARQEMVASGAPANGAAARERRVRAAADAFAARLSAASPHEREDLLLEYVRDHIAALLRLDAPQAIDRRSRLMELGLDSLMAVELRSRLSRGLTLPEPLPATLIFDYPTVDAITALLCRLLAVPAEKPEAAAADARVAPHSAESLAALTDEEVEARLLARLQMIPERADD